jgi:cell division transport system permease protein
MRLRLVVSEAFRSIGASASTSFATTMTVLIGMFLLGLSIALGTWVVSWSHHIKRELVDKIYFCTPESCSSHRYETPVERNAVARRIQAIPEVKSWKYISREQGLKLMQKQHPELTQNLASNPLPDAIEITPNHGDDVAKIATQLTTPHPAGVEKVDYGKKTARTVLTVAKVIWFTFLVGTILLLVASVLLVANTTRLAIFARRREIEVMKLVGATNWFVRGPFMIEGLLTGLAGSLAAVILLVLGKEFALPAILPHFDAGSDVKALAFSLNALIVLVVGLLVGAAGSGLTMRRFLRV